MNPIAKQILNNLKCPLCSAQLDLRGYNLAGQKKQFNFFCVADYRHYGIFFNHWDNPPTIIEEAAGIYDNNKYYWVYQSENYTQISVRDTDAEGRIIDNVPVLDFSSKKKLFDFHTANKDKILNRIKTILVFQ